MGASQRREEPRERGAGEGGLGALLATDGEGRDFEATVRCGEGQCRCNRERAKGGSRKAGAGAAQRGCDQGAIGCGEGAS